MRARSVVAVVTLVGLATLVGCDDEGSSGGCKGGTSPYAPYKLDMPEGWSRVKDTPCNLQYLGPKEADDVVQATVCVEYVRPPGRSRSSDLPPNFLLQHPGEYEGYEKVSEEDVKVIGRDCCKVVFTYKEGDRTRKAVGWFFIYKATGLVVLGVATPETFDRHLPVFEKTVRTLKLE